MVGNSGSIFLNCWFSLWWISIFFFSSLLILLNGFLWSTRVFLYGCPFHLGTWTLSGPFSMVLALGSDIIWRCSLGLALVLLGRLRWGPSVLALANCPTKFSRFLIDAWMFLNVGPNLPCTWPTHLLWRISFQLTSAVANTNSSATRVASAAETNSKKN